MFWPLRGNVNGTRERTERGCIYHRQIISKESSSNDKQLTKQARCRWHEPYGNFIENRYRRRGISNVRIKYSKTLAVVLAGSIVAGVPKNILPLLFLSPGQNPRGGYTWPKKKSVFQTDCCRPTASNRFWIHDRIPIPTLPLLFLSSSFFFRSSPT